MQISNRYAIQIAHVLKPNNSKLAATPRLVSNAPKVALLVGKAVEIRVPSSVRMVVHCARVIGVLIYSGATIIFRHEFLHFPVMLLGANGEFEIFSCDGIPVL